MKVVTRRVLDYLKGTPELIYGLIAAVVLWLLAVDANWMSKTVHSISEAYIALFVFYWARRSFTITRLSDMEGDTRCQREHYIVLGLAIVIAAAFL